MSEPDPLRTKRLGLGGILLVTGAVLVAGAVFVAPAVGPLDGTAVTTDLTAAPTPEPTIGSGTTSSAGATRTADTASSPAGETGPLVPVYWVGESGGVERLFREFRRSPAGASGDAISDAVHLMTSEDPLDPDYRSPWSPASEVSSSISTDNVITLDISADAFDGQLGEDEALLAVQQLIYTATAAASDAGLIRGGEASSVIVLVDATAGYRAFGSVDLGGEWSRDASVLAPVWIIDPQEGVGLDAGTLTVHGVVWAPRSSATWSILPLQRGRPDPGRPVSEGVVGIGGDDAAGTYSFSVDLPPGRYEITVSVPFEGRVAADSSTVVVG
ncbi:GerMN domain-containing protein [uncultured Arthrobacter sp.]|uniref:GerMN domain-containing protein n=1 Tax=uncultured Arthrobacter sp. TaxID=114050 RepID=UPI00260E18EE|nr:GerMN domain-containing protein [uncultured Arthrobacter sp.]